MERRKRVEMIMNSRLFREELERIIELQIKEGGGGPAGLLQQISDMMGVQGGRLHTNMFKSNFVYLVIIVLIITRYNYKIYWLVNFIFYQPVFNH